MPRARRSRTTSGLPTRGEGSGLAELEDIHATAERALEEVRGRSGRIIERDRDALLASYKAFAFEDLDDLSAEEHHTFYRWLRIIVYRHPEGE